MNKTVEPAATQQPQIKAFLQPYESDLLRVLINQGNLAVQAANENTKSYIIKILQERGLSPEEFGIEPNLRTIVAIQKPDAVNEAAFPQNQAKAEAKPKVTKAALAKTKVAPNVQ